MFRVFSSRVKYLAKLSNFSKIPHILPGITSKFRNIPVFQYAKDRDDDKEGSDNKGDKSESEGSSGGGNNIYKVIAGGLVVFVALDYFATEARQRGLKKDREITLERFLNDVLPSGSLHHLEYNSRTNEVYGYMNNHSDFQFFFRVLSPEYFQRVVSQAEQKHGVQASQSTPIMFNREMEWGKILFRGLIGVAPILLIYYFVNNALKGGIAKKLMNPMTKMDKLVKTKSTTKFDDVAGMDEAKKEIIEFVSFLKEPEKYQKLGARIPRGALLMGPPGTGKTLLAKAVAGEAEVDFYSMAGSDFVEMFVGVGAARVRDLFAQARKSKKAIIYIDEIDAIGKPRSSGMRGGGNDERESTLNQLLVELDGMELNHNIVVFASTNVSAEDLDAALLRPGRFDRMISVDKPDLAGRVAIYKIHMKPLKLAEGTNGVDVDRLANLTPGFSGAEIYNVCNEAAIIAARGTAENITMKDFELAIERVVGGIEKKHKIISPEEKKAIAYHESGHAIVAWFSIFCDPLLKISVIPRGNALGYAQYVPIERHITTFDHLKDIMSQALGGRAAEFVVFGAVSTGARDDLQKVTRIAYGAMCEYGMSSLGPIAFPTPGDERSSMQKPYGENIARIIDEEVRELVGAATQKAIDILKEKRDLLEKCADFLMKNEVMSVDQFREMAGPRPSEGQKL